MGATFKSFSGSLLAVDFTDDAVRVLDATVKRDTATVRSLATGSIGEGEAGTLPERHIEALKGVLATHRIRTKKCVATMPIGLVTTRSVMIDPSKGHSPEDQIRATMQNILTFDARDLMFDYWPVTQQEGTRTFEALVVATQRSVVYRYLEGFKRLKLTCVHLDVAPCALASLIAKLMPNQESMVGAVALGETMGYFAVAEKQKVIFWRPFELPGGKQNAQAALERVGDEISKCVSHMVGTLQIDAMSEILAFGPRAQDELFSKYLMHRFNLQVKTPSPFDALSADGMPAEIRGAMKAAEAGEYAAALGLALQPTMSTGGNNG